jgi:polysaccharide biosynthesis/export protein
MQKMTSSRPLVSRLCRAGDWCARLLVLSMLAVPAAYAQNAPSAEQLQIFQSLSPEQQQAVLQQLGGNRDGGDSTSGASSNRSTVSPSADRGGRGTGDVAFANASALAPNDVVVVELALPGDMAKGKAAPVAPIAGVRSGSAQQDPNGDIAPRRVRVAPLEGLPELEKKRLTDLIMQVQARNPYQLDRSGYLNLPGFAPILLGGLSEQQAVQRLSVEPALLMADISLLRLPVLKTGVEKLKPFGYDLFQEAPSTFAPVTDMPVPDDYVVGPGDKLSVQLFGSQNRSLNLVVSREGTVSFPELGPIRVAGQRFRAAKAVIEARVSQQMIGVRANVSMGDMRGIRVFVLGEVNQPGSYAVSGLATMTTALFAAGGIKPIGTLRDVQLKRQGAVARHFDLYDMLIRGDTGDDAKLQAGDVIFIPPVGPTVTVEGEVKRPAIYELRGETTSASLLQMAGGLTTEADPLRSSITRVDEQYRRIVLNVDFNGGAGRSQLLRNGDAVRVARLRPQLDSGVVLDGFVHRPGPVAWRQGLRISDVLGSIDELKPNADARYVLIRRESGSDRKVQVLSADLVAALSQRGSAADKELAPRDQVTVFDLAPGRERIIKPLLDELRLQSGLARPTEVVRVEGRVKVPGEYPLEPGMTVSDLLRAGGNLDAAAYGGKAELARYEVTGDGARQTELIEVNLEAILRGDTQSDVALRPFDYLLIKETPDWTDQESVTLAGEVRFPGTYPIRRGETLFEVLQRAGGLSSRAFAKGSAFTRIDLREREQKQLDLLSERMQADLAMMSVQAAAANQAGASQSLASGQALLSQLKQSRAVGRMVVDLQGLVDAGKGSAKDVILRDGDLLMVPPQRQEVTVIGEVQTTTSHLFRAGLQRDDYISLSGGATRKADMGKVYIVRADGSVLAQRSGMLRRGYNIAIQPGDTIVVPLDTERMPRLPFWQAVTQILYNVAISVAAIKSF